MSNTVNAIDQIRSSVDPSALMSISGVKNIPLADQLQFSSLLKTFVETPQEALSAVQGNKKHTDRTDFSSNLNTVGKNKEPNNRELNNRVDSSELRSEPLPVKETPRTKSKYDEPRIASTSRDALREGNNKSLVSNNVRESRKPSTTISINQNVKNDDVNAMLKGRVSEAIDIVKSSANEIPTRKFQSQSSLLNNQVSKSTNLKVQHNQVSDTNTISKTLTNLDSKVLNENIDPSTSQKIISKGMRGINSATSHTLAQQQAQELAQRLENGTRANIQVTSSENTGKQTSTPSQALTNSAPLLNIGSNGENENILANSGQRSSTNGLADRQTPNNHFPSQNNGTTFNTQSDTAAANFAQSIRVQAQLIAGQQSTHTSALAPKVAPISADTGNISNISSFNNFNQLSQTSKLNPSSTMNQPQKPPTPMEQVSVQIQRAVLNGADKINIKLHPAHLGRVEVRLDIATDGQLSAIIMAEKPETLELLQRDIKGLEKALQQAGLETNLNSFNFGLKQKTGQQTDQDETLKNADGKMPSDVIENSDDEVDPKLLMMQQEFGYNRAKNGGIDIRV